jgi:hypothetical protein
VGGLSGHACRPTFLRLSSRRPSTRITEAWRPGVTIYRWWHREKLAADQQAAAQAAAAEARSAREAEPPLRAGSFRAGNKDLHEFAGRTSTELETGAVAAAEILANPITSQSKILGKDLLRKKQPTPDERFEEGIQTYGPLLLSTAFGKLAREAANHADEAVETVKDAFKVEHAADEARAAKPHAIVGARSANSSFAYGPKIAAQIPKRGWSDALVDGTISNPQHVSPALADQRGRGSLLDSAVVAALKRIELRPL